MLHDSYIDCIHLNCNKHFGLSLHNTDVGGFRSFKMDPTEEGLLSFFLFSMLPFLTVV